MSIRAVIFDFGNVVGFFDHRRATRRLARFSPLPEEAIYEFLFNGRLEDDFEAGRLSVPDFLRTLHEACRIQGDDEDLASLFGDIFTPNAEVCALVPELKARYRLVLGSNCTPLHSQQFRRQFADTLKNFDGLVLSHKIGVRKPKAAFYQECVRIGACAAEECVFIDDLHANVEGAIACGLHGVVYRQAAELHDMMRALGIQV
ncbi:MAG TPA: HAD family phosphatase [Gemmataceae bacterium]